jgi:uncharacterized protein YjbJ (UPF0337 family)
MNCSRSFGSRCSTPPTERFDSTGAGRRNETWRCLVTGHRTVRRETPGKGSQMGLDDKISNKVEETGGEVKERVGDATGDEQLEAEGKGDQASGNLKQAGEKVKDVFKS